MKRLFSSLLVLLLLAIPARLMASLETGRQDVSTFSGDMSALVTSPGGSFKITGSSSGDPVLYCLFAGLYTQNNNLANTGPFVFTVAADGTNEASFRLDSLEFNNTENCTITLDGTDVYGQVHTDSFPALVGTQTLSAGMQNYGRQLVSYKITATATSDIRNFALPAFTVSNAVAPGAQPSVSAVSPSIGSTGGGASVVITGTNFTSANAVKFGSTDATSYTVNSATQITAVAPAGALGTVHVTVYNTYGISATGTADQYTYTNLPTITSVSPTSGPAAGGNSVVITGFNFTGATTVSFGATNASTFSVDSDTQITATAPAVAAGTIHITVTTPSGTSTTGTSDQYTFVAAPTITSLGTTAGPTAGGTSVVITGTNFSGATSVKFGATNATGYTVNSATQITATAPAGSAGTVDVTVTTVGGTSATSSADQYTYVAAPTITSVSPGSGPTSGGTTITITGTNFTPVTSVKFGATNATGFTVDSATQITATSPAGSAGTVDVTVVSPGGTSATSAADQYIYVAAPTVTAVSPTSGPLSGGTTVTITGTSLSTATAVKFGATNATGFTVNSATQITATAPAGSAGTVDITVITVGGTSATGAADQYTYVAAPTVTSLSVTSGPTAGSTSVVITGTNFTGATAVKFGATNASSFTIDSATQITATSPAGSAGTVDVTVVSAGGTSATGAADQFTYVAAPTITSLGTTAGPTAGATSVVITGTNFLPVTAVKFGATNASSFTVNSATQITATSPAGSAGTVDVTVVSAGGTSATSAADQYTYVAAPTVSSLGTTAGPAAGGTSVVITGTNFTGASAVKFGATNATGYTVNSATQITATSPAGSAGTVDVTVTTTGGTSATGAADQYTYVAAPTVTSLGTTTGPTAGGTSVVITGTNFTGASAVKFGATNATGYTVNSATQITATSPAGSAGTVDVTVTTTGGTSATGAGDQFTYVAAPTVTSLGTTTGPTAGGTSVVITGTNFTGATAVKFGATNATSFTVNSATQITATSPAGAAGTVDVTVTSPGGTSATGAGDQFSYIGLPTVTSVSPTGGPLAGGTSVTLTGTAFTGATAVKFGATNATSFTVNSATQITATSPAGSAGTVNITVTTPGGTSVTGLGNQYTYLTTPSITSALTASGNYGEAIAAYTITATNSPTSFGATGLPPGLSVNTTTGQITGTPTAAGSFSATISATNSGNTGSATLVFTIAKATLTITANDATRPYQGANPAFSVRFTGLKNGDTGASLTVQPTLDCKALPESDAGTYPIVPSGASTPNYELYYVAGTLTVTKLPQTISFVQPGDQPSNAAPFSLSAIASSGLPVSFSVVNGPALLTGGTLSLTGAPGTVTVRASQAGDTNHEAATPVDRSFTVISVQQQVYQGTISSGSYSLPIAVVYTPQTRQGTLIGSLPGLYESFRIAFTVDLNGLWTSLVTTNVTTSAGVMRIESSTAASTSSGVSRTFHGSLSGSSFTGSVDGLSVSLNATAQPLTGATSGVSGYYSASRLYSSQGSLDLIVGTQGQGCLVLNSQGSIANLLVSVDPDGSFRLASPYQASTDTSGRTALPAGFSITGRLDAQATSVQASVTSTGNPEQTFSGLSSTTQRTDRLSNLSTLGQVSSSNNVTLITGFVISGPQAKPVLLRAVGPSLGSFGITNALAAPRLRIVQNGTLLKEVTGWKPELASEFTRLGAFQFQTGSTDAAVELNLDPGVYTMQVLDGDASGSALAEIYDASLNPQADYQRLVNISSRGSITSSAQQLTGGFVFGGNSPKKILVRAVGPGLTAYGVQGALSDPSLKLYNASSTVIAGNDNWETPTSLSATQAAASADEIRAAAAATGAFALGTGSKDAALLITLPPGVYTATVTSAAQGGTGVTLIEIYEVP